MAIYHFSAQIMGRGKGRKNLDGSPKKAPDNAVAAAAYRAGERLHDEREGKAQDYSHRAGVEHREIIVPEGGAGWLADREKLWNTVEQMESRNDAQLAREFNMALPHQLSADERRVLVQDFVREQFVGKGMVADFALHSPVAEKGDDPRNFHAHVMLTLRKATQSGLHAVKTREWNSRDQLNAWRKAWQEHANRALARAGRAERVDHRTLGAQREEAVARGDRKAALLLARAPEIHVGPRPKAMKGREVEPVSQVRERGSRRQRPASHMRETSPRRQSYEAFQRERAERRDQERAAFAEERMQRAKERWAKRKAWEDRQRDAGHREDRREPRGQGVRRSRDYPGSDRGPRIGFLWDILSGNNAKLKADIARIDTRAARLTQWMDFQARKAEWWLSGQVGGAGYRYQRWQAAKTERERRQVERDKAEHAKKRAAQLQALTKELRSVVAALSFQLERGLGRARQVEGWGRAAERVVARGRQASRGRRRTGPSGPNGASSASGSGNPRAR